MTKFALSGKRKYDTITGKIPKSKKTLELVDFEGRFILRERENDDVNEIWEFTKEELVTLWTMLTER